MRSALEADVFGLQHELAPQASAEGGRGECEKEQQAWRSATNGRGPWWNAGAAHMKLALPKKHFDALGLVSLLDQLHQLQRTSRTAVYVRKQSNGKTYKALHHQQLKLWG